MTVLWRRQGTASIITPTRTPRVPHIEQLEADPAPVSLELFVRGAGPCAPAGASCSPVPFRLRRGERASGAGLSAHGAADPPPDGTSALDAPSYARPPSRSPSPKRSRPRPRQRRPCVTTADVQRLSQPAAQRAHHGPGIRWSGPYRVEVCIGGRGYEGLAALRGEVSCEVRLLLWRRRCGAVVCAGARGEAALRRVLARTRT